jgi:hypothetical protein
MPETTITIALNRAFDADDENRIRRLVAEWLVYDVKIQRSRESAEIKLFHSTGAKPHLIRELSELYPDQSLIGS